MNIGEKIRSGVKWLALGKIGNRFMEFAFGVILARLLVPADFGMIATVSVFTGFVGLLTSGGMGQSLVRAKQADENDFTAVFTLQLGMGIGVYGMFYLAAPWIAHYFHDPLYTDLIRVSALSFLLRPFVVMRNAWLNREMNYKSRTMVEVMAGFITGLASSVMAWLGLGVWSLVLSGLVGAMYKIIWLARLTPLKLRLNPNLAIMRKHSSYGFKTVVNDFVTYLRNESKNLILSKLAGPSFLGLFNKGESMSRLPNQLLMSATMEPLFRAMSTAQDNLDQCRYLYYRTITLLMVYTMPLYVLLWWVADPFISVVYGPKWVEASGPLAILAVAGVFLNVIYPSGVVLAAQNRLGREIVAQLINLAIIIAAVYMGLDWGLEGVAWGLVLSHALLATHFHWLTRNILPGRSSDLPRAAAPGLMLSALLWGVLFLTDAILGDAKAHHPFIYLLVMSCIGGLSHVLAFLLLPIPALAGEAKRWRQKLHHARSLILRRT